MILINLETFVIETVLPIDFIINQSTIRNNSKMNNEYEVNYDTIDE